MNLPEGTAKTLRSVWTDNAGDPVNPAVTLTVRDPDDNLTNPGLSNPETGTFETSDPVTFDVVGIWYWEFVGTTAEGTKVCDGSVCIVPSKVLVSS